MKRQVVRRYATKVFRHKQPRTHLAVAQLVWLQTWKTTKLTRVRWHYATHMQRVKFRARKRTVWWAGVSALCREHALKSVA